MTKHNICYYMIFDSHHILSLNKYWLKTIPNDSKREISSGRSFLGKGI